MRRYVAGILSLLLLGVAAEAHAISFGVGVLGDMPTEELDETTQYGYGLYGNMDRNLFPLVDLRLQAEANRFVLEDNIPGDDFTSWGFLAGGKVDIIGVLNGGALFGYYTEVDEVDLVPFVGVKMGWFNVGLQYKGLVGDAKWLGARVGISFGTPGIGTPGI